MSSAHPSSKPFTSHKNTRAQPDMEAITPAHESQRQEDHEFKNKLGYIMRSCLETKMKNKKS
jgi:hypothetical protein